MRLTVALPDYDVRASLRLYDQAAPTVCSWIWDTLAKPFETKTSHACFDGHEVFCFLPGRGSPPPIENQSMRPAVGEVMFFGAEPRKFAALNDNRLIGQTEALFEMAFMYGQVDLRHFWEEGLHGSIIGQIDQNFEAFASACLATLNAGATAITISRGE
ncbi:DUF3830 family protein [Novosphingobium pentaromativorans]|nr:DUF3830 family protein [Novosphingobium pentaromativorans]